MDELGIPTYDELVLVANSDRVEDQSVRLFIAALERGTRDAIRDPEAATDAVLAAGDDLDPELTDEIERAAARESEPPLRLHEPASGRSSRGFLADAGVIGALPETEEMLTNGSSPTDPLRVPRTPV